MNREKLTKALSSTRAGLADKEIVEHSTSFVFSNGQVITYNDAVSVRYPLDIGVEGAVSAAPIMAFLGRVSADEVKIEQKENELILKCGRAKAGIPVTAEVPKHLTSLKVPKKGWEDIPKGFEDAIKLCLFTASKDMTKPILNNLHIQSKTVESADNYRATRTLMKGAIGTEILLPLAAAKNLPSFAPKEYVVTKTWAHFRNEDKVVLSCRLFAGEYPELDGFFKLKGESVEFPAKLKDILERAGVFSTADFDTDREVLISVTKGRMKVRAESQDGWFEETVKAPDVEDMSFRIHPVFLADILAHSSTATLADNAMLFKDKHFSHVVSL